MTVLLTPAEVHERYPLMSEWFIREQARRGRVPHTRTGKGRISFTEEQVDALLAYASRPVTAEEPVKGLDSLLTKRSRRSA